MNSKPLIPPKTAPKRKSRRTLLLSLLALACLLALGAGLLLALLPRVPTALSYKGISVDRDMYAFWYATLKSDFMVRHGIKTDNDATWSTACPLKEHSGRTWGEVLGTEIHEAIRLKLAAAMLYDEMGLSMATGQAARVSSYLDDLLEYAADGKRDELREILRYYRTTERAVKKCAAFDLKAELLYYWLSLDSGKNLEAEEILAYYSETYTRVKVVYINDSVYGSYENGERTETPLDFINGPGAQNGEDEAALDAHLVNGDITEAAFEEFLARSDEGLHAEGAYPHGIYSTLGQQLWQTGFLDKTVAEAAYDLDPGVLRKVTTERGVAFLLGYALDTGSYVREESAVFFDGFFSRAAEAAITERAAALLPEIEEHPEAYAELTVFTVPHNKGELWLCSMR